MDEKKGRREAGGGWMSVVIAAFLLSEDLAMKINRIGVRFSFFFYNVAFHSN